MTAQSFFKTPKGLTIAEIAELTGAKPRDGTDFDHVVHDIATLSQARPTDLSFFETVKYVDQLTETRAGACSPPEPFPELIPAPGAVVLPREPFRDFVAVSRKLYPDSLRP